MTNLIERAALFAEQAHRGQVRKYTGEPYINHPAEVAKIVSTLIRSTDEMIAAAWLHDVVEDTETSLAEIDHLFGAHVAFLVDGLTDVSKPSHGNRAARKELDRIHLAAGTHEIHTIKLADLISNSSTIARYDSNFAKVYFEEKRQLLNVMQSGDQTLHAIATALAKP